MPNAKTEKTTIAAEVGGLLLAVCSDRVLLPHLFLGVDRAAKAVID